MLYTYKPMITVVFSVVLDLNLGLTVRTQHIFDTMYNVFTSFHSRVRKQVSVREKLIHHNHYSLPDVIHVTTQIFCF